MPAAAGTLAFLGRHMYAVLFLGMLLDTAGLPIPGELLLLSAGYFAYAGQVDIVTAILAGALGAVVGDHVGYCLGRLGGRRLLDTYCRVTLGSGRCVEQTVSYFRRFGALTIAMARFIVGLRLLASPLAGSAAVPYRSFVLFDAAGALLWSALFTGAGYELRIEWGMLARPLGQVQHVLLVMAAVAVAVAVSVRLWRRARYGKAHVGEDAPMHVTSTGV